jgi:hypothetical protein
MPRMRSIWKRTDSVTVGTVGGVCGQLLFAWPSRVGALPDREPA